MSSYAGIYVNGREVFTYRNQVFPEVIDLFTRDEFLRLKGQEALPYASNWHVMSDEPTEEVEAQIYRVSAGVLRDRLRVLGFDEPLVRSFVEKLVEEEIKIRSSALRHVYDDELKEYSQRQLAYFQSFDYEVWKAEVGAHLAVKQTSPKPDWRNKGPLDLFEEADERILLRVIVDQVRRDLPIVLDVTDLVDNGYLDADEDTAIDWWSGWGMETSVSIQG